MKQSSQLEASVWLGRNGITEEFLDQVSRQLETRQLVKVKVQESAGGDVEASHLAGRVARSIGAILVDVRGRTFTIFKAKKARPPRRLAKSKSKVTISG